MLAYYVDSVLHFRVYTFINAVVIFAVFWTYKVVICIFRHFTIPISPIVITAAYLL